MTARGQRQGFRYEVLGPRLRKLLLVIFALVALLGANSAYLASITFLGWWNRGSGHKYEDWFYLWMILFHLAFGLLLVVPLVVFGVSHWRTARHLPNRRAMRIGQALFLTALLVLASGIVLMLFGLGTESVERSIVYWLHVISPLVAVWLYVLHRLAGPAIRWRLGAAWGGVVAASLVAMILFHFHDPRTWNQIGPEDGLDYFRPSLSRTASGNYIPAHVLMNDQYCLECHPGIHERWKDSVHRFSSFNNPAYLFTVRETRKKAGIKESRFCAGCHDPVPFFSGKFDDPKYDDIENLKRDPTAHAGITCTVCHAITAVNSPRGNADFTIEEPIHYPFAFSRNPILRYINRQLIKAKPSFHKKTFLKSLHKSAEFCGTCHKVHLPEELNRYKFLRGQNHYDSFLLSGVSGGGARSFYYPKIAHSNCNGCHMPLQESDDFAAKLYPGATKPSVHDHLFVGANTAIAHWRGRDDIVKAHQKFLKDCVRVDLFGLREGTSVVGSWHPALRPNVPELKPGGQYVLESVVRTLTLGHHFTQGTADSNEIWLDVTVRDGKRVIGRSGAIRDDGSVDEWSYFLNVYMLDRDGNRIDRRNAQDIFVPLYNHQIPPGAGRLARFGLKVPEDTAGPITVDVKVNYRKFDQTYLRHVWGRDYKNDLPVTVLATDRVTFPVAGGNYAGTARDSPIPTWQRWNDYGIALLLESQDTGKGSDRQSALRAFQEVERLGRPDGALNAARVHLQIGNTRGADDALRRVAKHPDKRDWTFYWLSAQVSRQRGLFDRAIGELQHGVLEYRTEETQRQGLDFSRDYEVINDLGVVLFERSKQSGLNDTQRSEFRRQAVEQFQRTLEIDPENVAAHYNLSLLYALLGRQELANEHAQLHLKYKIDDNARDRAQSIARKNSEAADHAVTVGAIHPIHPVER